MYYSNKGNKYLKLGQRRNKSEIMTGWTFLDLPRAIRKIDPKAKIILPYLAPGLIEPENENNLDTRCTATNSW